jgi:hypothetical protein
MDNIHDWLARPIISVVQPIEASIVLLLSDNFSSLRKYYFARTARDQYCVAIK